MACQVLCAVGHDEAVIEGFRDKNGIAAIHRLVKTAYDDPNIDLQPMALAALAILLADEQVCSVTKSVSLPHSPHCRTHSLSSLCVSQCKVQFRQMDGIPLLASLLASTDDGVLAHTADCITAITEDERCCRMFVEHETGGETLLKLLTSTNEDVFGAVAMAVASCCDVESFRVAAVKDGALALLLGQLGRDDRADEDYRPEILALGMLCREADARAQFIQSNGLALLLACISSASTSMDVEGESEPSDSKGLGVARMAARALAAILVDGESRSRFRELGGVEHLCGLVSHSDEIVQRWAVTALAHACMDAEVQKQVYKQGVISMLPTLLSSTNASIVQWSATAIGNVCAHEQSVGVLLNAQAVAALLKLTNHVNMAVKVSAVYALGRISRYDSARVAVEQANGCVYLADLLKVSEPAMLQHLTLTLSNCNLEDNFRVEFVEQNKGVEALFSALKKSSESGSETLTCRLMHTLGICFTHAKAVTNFRELGGIPMITSFLKKEQSAELRMNSMSAVSFCCEDFDSVTSIIQSGLQDIIDALNVTTDVSVLERATYAMAALCTDSRCRDLVLKLGVVDRLVSLFGHTDHEVAINALGAVTCCCVDRELASLFSTQSTHDALLFSALTHDHPKRREFAAHLMAVCCGHPRYIVEWASQHDIDRLFDLVKAENDSVVIEGLNVLSKAILLPDGGIDKESGWLLLSKGLLNVLRTVTRDVAKPALRRIVDAVHALLVTEYGLAGALV